jgi:hypothetical protein
MDGHLWETEPSDDLECADPNWMISPCDIATPIIPDGVIPDLNFLCTHGIGPHEFRLLRQGNPQILKRLDGRVWSTRAVPLLIDQTIVLSATGKAFHLSHNRRAPWESTDQERMEDLTLYKIQQQLEQQGNLLDSFSLSYSHYKQPRFNKPV